MKVDLDGYKIVSKIFLGTNLKFVFQNLYDAADKKVLELMDIVGFIETAHAEQAIKTLRLDKEGGSYSFDLSLRLSKQEINNFPEVFIFVDTDCVSFCFRAVAKFIEFREWNVKDKWLP
jgi:hypothetical protein